MTRPSPARLRREMARLAHAFHWPPDVLLDLEHHERRSYLAEAVAIGATPMPPDDAP